MKVDRKGGFGLWIQCNLLDLEYMFKIRSSDGTKGFLRGEQFAVCLALIEDGKVQVAIQGCPNLLHNIHDPNSERGSIFIAVRNQGAFEVSFITWEK